VFVGEFMQKEDNEEKMRRKRKEREGNEKAVSFL
jgi:hypothetical protein